METMTLKERREQWEKGGDVKLVAVHNEPIGKGSVYKTLYVILDFRGEYHLHRYFPMAMGVEGTPSWEVSVDISNSTMDKCLNEVTEAMEDLLPKE